MGLKGARQEAEVSQHGFCVIAPGSDLVTHAIVQRIEQDLFVATGWKERVWGWVILPEGTQVKDLQALDGFR